MPWGKGHLGLGRLVAYLTLSSPFPKGRSLSPGLAPFQMEGRQGVTR